MTKKEIINVRPIVLNYCTGQVASSYPIAGNKGLLSSTIGCLVQFNTVGRRQRQSLFALQKLSSWLLATNNYMEKEYKGYNGTVVLTDRAVIIKRGAKGFLLGGGMLRGDKTIPYSGIIAVQLKKAGMTAGYIQFTLMGGSEAKGGLFQSAMDENSVNFHTYGGKNELFAECKKIVEERMGRAIGGVQSSADEIAKMAELRDKGILSEEEFQQKKKLLLGI